MTPSRTKRPAWRPDDAAIDAIVARPAWRSLRRARHARRRRHGASVRVFWPGADSVEVVDARTAVPSRRSSASSRTASSPGRLRGRRKSFRLPARLSRGGDDLGGRGPLPLSPDPRRASTSISSARAGTAASTSGSAPTRRTIDGVAGVAFAVWAPNATRVSVVGDFNQWDGRRHPMRKRVEAGVWELFIPGVAPRRPLQVRAARRRRPACCRSRPTRSASPPSCRRRPLRASTACRLRLARRRLDGRSARRTRRSTRRSRSTRSTSARGGARRAIGR